MNAKRSRRLAVALSTLTLGALALTACAAPGQSVEAGYLDPAELEPVTITMWQHSYPAMNDWTQAMIAEFEAEYPNIDVEFELIPFEEFNQKALTALAAGQGPDVFESDDYTFAQFAQNGALAELDPRYFSDDEASFADLYEPNSLNLVTQDDAVYGLPYDWEAPVLAYNIGLLDEAGIDPAELSGDWTTALETAEKLTVREGDSIVQSGFSFVHGIDVYYQLQGSTLFSQAGARVLNEDGTAAAINSPEAAEVFQLWSDAIWKYKVTSPGFTSSFYTEEFGQGRVASGWMYVWANSILEPAGYVNGVDFGLGQVPSFEGSAGPSASYSWNWTLNAKSTAEEQSASSALLAYLSERGDSQLESAGLINPRLGWRDKISPELTAAFQPMFDGLANSEPIEPNAEFNQIWAPIIALFKEIEASPDVDIESRLAEVSEQIDAVLK